MYHLSEIQHCAVCRHSVTFLIIHILFIYLFIYLQFI
jgi:hypothetical protein